MAEIYCFHENDVFAPAPPNARSIVAPLYISQKEAAVMLACSVQLISKLIKTGRLPALRVGRAIRIKLSDLLAALEVR